MLLSAAAAAIRSYSWLPRHKVRDMLACARLLVRARALQRTRHFRRENTATARTFDVFLKEEQRSRGERRGEEGVLVTTRMQHADAVF